MTTIGIIGSRRRDTNEDYQKTLDKFNELYEEGVTIVSGGCPQGGDRFAEMIAEHFDIPITIHYALWNRHGRAAGFIRNSYIARDADILIAVVAYDRKGGTEDTIRKFKRLHPNGEIYLV